MKIHAPDSHACIKDVDESELRRQFSIPEVPPVMSDSWFDQVNTFKEMEDSTMSQDSVDVFTGWSAAQDYPEGHPLEYEDREARGSSQELDQDVCMCSRQLPALCPLLALGCGFEDFTSLLHGNPLKGLCCLD